MRKKFNLIYKSYSLIDNRRYNKFTKHIQSSVIDIKDKLIEGVCGIHIIRNGKPERKRAGIARTEMKIRLIGTITKKKEIYKSIRNTKLGVVGYTTILYFR